MDPAVPSRGKEAPLRSLRLHVPPDAAGARLDVVIARLAPELSRRAARRLIGEGSVYVGGRRTRVLSRTVDAGDEILLELDRPEPVPAPPDDELVLALEPSFAVVKKPAGMPTEPTRQAAAGTVAVALKDALRRAGHDVSYLVAAHRLDADTSGALLFARTRQAASRLSKQFREGTIERRYLAVVAGTPDFVTTRIDAPLSRHPDEKGRFFVEEDGLPAATLVTVLVRGEGASLLLAQPLTGRTHQLRVHLLHAGHPLIGDRRYGGASAEEGHLGLHALSLGFEHPGAPRRVRFVVEPPEAFLEACARHGIPAVAVAAAVDNLRGGSEAST